MRNKVNHYIQNSTQKSCFSRRATSLKPQKIVQLKASYAHSSEPTLFPKLRICFAEFPYLHYIEPEASNLGNLMRLLVRSCKLISSLDFQGVTKQLRDTTHAAALFHIPVPYLAYTTCQGSG